MYHVRFMRICARGLFPLCTPPAANTQLLLINSRLVVSTTDRSPAYTDLFKLKFLATAAVTPVPTASSDFDRFLAVPASSEVNTLGWWREHAAAFPAMRV